MTTNIENYPDNNVRKTNTPWKKVQRVLIKKPSNKVEYPFVKNKVEDPFVKNKVKDPFVEKND